MKTRAERAGDQWVLNGSKAFITNAGVGGDRRGDGRAPIPPRGRAASRPSSWTRACRASARASPTASSACTPRHRRADLRGRRGCPPTSCAASAAQGFVQAMQVLEGGRIAMAAMARGHRPGRRSTRRVKYMKQRSAFGRTLAEFNGLQGMIAEIAHRGRGGAPADPARRRAQGRGPARHARGRRWPRSSPPRSAMKAATKARPDPRRRRLHHRVPRRAHLPRRQAHRDRRGHLGDPAHGDRARDPRIQIVEGPRRPPPIRPNAVAAGTFRRRSRPERTPESGCGERDLSEPSVLYQVADGVGTITLNRPRVLNALDVALSASARRRGRARRRADPAVWVVVVRGAGRAFCSGMDRKALSAGEIGERVLPALDPRPQLPRGHGQAVGRRAPRLLDRRRPPARAWPATSGSPPTTPSSGSGATRHALIPDGSILRLARIVGLGRAKELTLLNDHVRPRRRAPWAS